MPRSAYISTSPPTPTTTKANVLETNILQIDSLHPSHQRQIDRAAPQAFGRRSRQTKNASFQNISKKESLHSPVIRWVLGNPRSLGFHKCLGKMVGGTHTNGVTALAHGILKLRLAVLPTTLLKIG